METRIMSLLACKSWLRQSRSRGNESGGRVWHLTLSSETRADKRCCADAASRHPTIAQWLEKAAPGYPTEFCDVVEYGNEAGRRTMCKVKWF